MTTEHTTPDLIATADIERANIRAGRYWFSPDALRFFKSRVASCGYLSRAVPGVAFFTSSERGPDGVRRYSVRVALPDAHGDPGGAIETAGDFQQYATRSGADRAAVRLASITDAADLPADVRRYVARHTRHTEGETES